MELYNETHKVIKAIRKRFNIYHEIPCTADDRRVQEIIGIVVRTIEALPTADVVPKSEVDWNSIPVDVSEALKQRAVEKAKAELAREIFEEIEDVLNNIGYFDELDFKALKKKYTENKE